MNKKSEERNAHKTIIRNRRSKPIFKRAGTLTPTSKKILWDYAMSNIPSLGTAHELRERDILQHDPDKDLTDYGQIDIQYAKDNSPNMNYNPIRDRFSVEPVSRHPEDSLIPKGGGLSEADFTEYDSLFEPVMKELNSMGLHGICRLRLAVLEPMATLRTHIDSPYKDRFLCVIDGGHDMTFHKANVGEDVTLKFVPDEIWYVNTNWKHTVINTLNHKRTALLGCFDYDPQLL